MVGASRKMYDVGKRVIDIAGALIALIIATPVVLVLGMLIKIFDPGPVIFTQKRSGRSGRTFQFYKLRSLPVTTGDIPSDQLGEVRLPWISRFLRRSNLDELPQFYNVLIGDMSLIGPRPALPTQTELLLLREENGAAQLRPGLTGWAQVNAYDGMPVTRKAELDGEYYAKRSLLTDAKVMLRTFAYLTRPPPKY